MKRHEKKNGKVLDAALGLYANPSPEEIESAPERFLNRVQSENTNLPRTVFLIFEPVHRPASWRRVAVVAAAAVIALAIFASVRRRGPVAAEIVDGSRKIPYGEIVRSIDQAGTVLVLADGSRVEMRSRSELALERADDGARIRLSRGSVIVNAAKQREGHLYVQTKDVEVSVVGTVFMVIAEEVGSRVAVIDGEVEVQQGTVLQRLLPGQQVATNPVMPAVPLIDAIRWSRNVVAHTALLEHVGVSPDAPFRFQFISIHSPAYPRSPRFVCRGVDGLLGLRGIPESRISPHKGSCLGQPDIVDLIAVAYGVRRPNVLGGPEWIRAAPGSGKVQRFDIEAKAGDPVNVTKDQLAQMLQFMLADRFKVKVRRETRDGDGIALVVAPKYGALLKPASGDEEPPHEDGTSVGPNGADLVIKGKSSLSKLADYLLPVFGQPLVDKTNLPGMYEYTLKLHQPRPIAGGQRGSTGGDGSDSYSPPASTALQQQLGLRVEPAKVPIETIIIEEVEKPSEN
jgi:uncharacterized protein (TIGR03435 family)